MRCFAYARVSTKEQEQGYSIPAQQKLLEDYAMKNGLVIEQWFVEAESGKKTDRSQFLALIKAIKKEKKPCHLLVEKTDRLARNFKDHVTIGELMDQRGLQVHYVKEGAILNADSHSHLKLMHDIKVVLAKNYIDNLTEEVKKGMWEKAEQGWPPGNVPHGYRNNKDTRRIDIVWDQARFVKKAFELYATGHYSLAGVIEQLFEDGYIYKAGKERIDKGTLESMLKNTFYKGVFAYKGRLMPGKYETFISSHLFDQVQANFLLVNRPRQVKREFAFTGLITCAVCGCSITAQMQRERYIYYYCTNWKKTCGGQSFLREEELTTAFAQAVKEIEVPEKLIPRIIQTLKEGHNEQMSYYKEQSESIQREIAKLRSRIDKLLEMKLDGEISQQEWQRKQNQYVMSLNRLEQTRDEHNAGSLDYVDNANRLLELSQGAYHKVSGQTPSNIRKMVKLVLFNTRLDRGKLVYEYRKPFDIFAKMRSSKEWWAIGDLNTGPHPYQGRL